MPGLIELIVVLVVLGLIWWLVTTYLPLPQPVKTVVTVLMVLVLVLYLLSLLGLVGPLRVR